MRRIMSHTLVIEKKWLERMLSPAIDYGSLDKTEGLPTTEGLEDIPQTENDATVSTIGSPLVEEVGGINTSFGDTEIACIRRIVKFGSELDPLIFTNLRILEDSKIDVVDSVST